MLTLYTFQREDGQMMQFTTRHLHVADEYARQHGVRLVAQYYKLIGVERVADFGDPRVSPQTVLGEDVCFADL